jgi:hypothetical protein
VKGDAKLRVLRKIFVCLGYMLLKVLEQQAVNRQHGRRLALSTLNRILNNTWLEREDGEQLLTAQAGEEKPLKGPPHIVKEGRIICGRGYGNGGDKALGVAGCASEACRQLRGR